VPRPRCCATKLVIARPSPKSKTPKYPMTIQTKVSSPKRSMPRPCTSLGIVTSATMNGNPSPSRLPTVLRAKRLPAVGSLRSETEIDTSPGPSSLVLRRAFSRILAQFFLTTGPLGSKIVQSFSDAVSQALQLSFHRVWSQQTWNLLKRMNSSGSPFDWRHARRNDCQLRTSCPLRNGVSMQGAQSRQPFDSYWLGCRESHVLGGFSESNWPPSRTSPLCVPNCSRTDGAAVTY